LEEDQPNSYAKFAGHDGGWKLAILNQNRFLVHLTSIKMGPAP